MAKTNNNPNPTHVPHPSSTPGDKNSSQIPVFRDPPPPPPEPETQTDG